jgi:hypothetical protein
MRLLQPQWRSGRGILPDRPSRDLLARTTDFFYIQKGYALLAIPA